MAMIRREMCMSMRAVDAYKIGHGHELHVKTVGSVLFLGRSTYRIGPHRSASDHIGPHWIKSNYIRHCLYLV